MARDLATARPGGPDLHVAHARDRAGGASGRPGDPGRPLHGSDSALAAGPSRPRPTRDAATPRGATPRHDSGPPAGRQDPRGPRGHRREVGTVLHAPGRSSLGPALPSVDDYLALLPDGLASYPLVATTGMTVRRLVEDPLHALSAGSGLPPALAEHVLHPPGARAWVPVVHLVALHAALYDLDFSERDGPEGYAEWVFRRNVDLLRTPALRTIASVASPATMLRLFLVRWRSLYRGLTAEVREVTSREATVRFAYPPHCWTGLSHVAMTGVLRAVLVVSGAEEASVDVEVESVRAARFALRWR